ncbi:MAG: hypothetical protein GXY70_07415 [Euryarchaeota archaeon]|nr:hypothetical protein [Euryarchaeota archaeon]
MELAKMETKEPAGPSVRKYLVARDQEVLGTYTTLRIAMAAAATYKATVYAIESCKDCVVNLAQYRSFEEVA